LQLVEIINQLYLDWQLNVFQLNQTIFKMANAIKTESNKSTNQQERETESQRLACPSSLVL
jgi:hypothetical protein